MRLGLDIKTTKALLDTMAEIQIDAARRIAQTAIVNPETGKPMSGREASESLKAKLEKWREANT